jgi:hypothetical protein
LATTKIDGLTLTGRSGHAYDFRIYVWHTKFKPLAGVYAIAERSVEPGKPPHYAPVFVGSADDLSKVLNNHPRTDCFQLHYANVIGVLKEGDAAARERITADLIGALTPPCNAADAE